MSLPENTSYGGAVSAQGTLNEITLVKAKPGLYVPTTLDVDQVVNVNAACSMRKDGNLDFLVKFTEMRNSATVLGGGTTAANPSKLDNELGVWIKAVGPVATSSTDGRFTQDQFRIRVLQMAHFLLQTGVVEKIIRGEQ